MTQYYSDPILFSGNVNDLITSYSQGSILFANANGKISEDNSNLFYDDVNFRLGLGTNQLENTSPGGITFDVGATANPFIFARHDNTDHPFTGGGLNEDVFLIMEHNSNTAGGFRIAGYTSDRIGLQLRSYYAISNTFKVQSAKAPIYLDCRLHDGAGAGTVPGPDDNLLVIAGRTEARTIIDNEGTYHLGFAGDMDYELINVHVTGNPIFSWADGGFMMNKNLVITDQGNIVNFCAGTQLVDIQPQVDGFIGLHFKPNVPLTNNWAEFRDNVNTVKFAVTQNGYLSVADRIQHEGDTNTYVNFTTDKMDFYCGGRKMLTLKESITDSIIINEGGYDVDFRVETLNRTKAIWVEGGRDAVHIEASLGYIVSEVNLPYSVTNYDHVIVCYGSGVLTLQSANARETQHLTIINGNIAGETVQIQPSGGELINGQTSIMLTDTDECVSIDSDKFTGHPVMSAYNWIVSSWYKPFPKRTIVNSTDPGTAGQRCWDDDYIYICTMNNKWERVAINTW